LHVHEAYCCINKPVFVSVADCPQATKGKGKDSSPCKGKRKANVALAGAKRARRGGGICLSDDEGEPSTSMTATAEDEAEEEQNAEAAAHESVAAQEEAKPKPKSAMDDIFAEMKRDTTVKKAPAAKTDISSFINGLVSKSSNPAASKGGKFDVASLFPTSVSKKQTVKVNAT